MGPYILHSMFFARARGGQIAVHFVTPNDEHHAVLEVARIVPAHRRRVGLGHILNPTDITHVRHVPEPVDLIVAHHAVLLEALRLFDDMFDHGVWIHAFGAVEKSRSATEPPKATTEAFDAGLLAQQAD